LTLSAGRHIITLKPLTMLFLRCLLVICLSSFPVAQAFSQAGTASPGDSIELPYPFTDELRYPFSNSGVTSPLYLNNPSNVVQTVVYDPVTN